MDPKTRQTLTKLEESLWRAATRFDDALMDQLFAEDLIEFGRSGRIYTRSALFLGDTPAQDIDATLPLPELQVRHLTSDLAQVTYTSKVRDGANVEWANRSSLWRREGANWRLCFHQGTPCAAPS